MLEESDFNGRQEQNEFHLTLRGAVVSQWRFAEEHYIGFVTREDRGEEIEIVGAKQALSIEETAVANVTATTDSPWLTFKSHYLSDDGLALKFELLASKMRDPGPKSALANIELIDEAGRKESHAVAFYLSILE